MLSADAGVAKPSSRDITRLTNRIIDDHSIRAPGRAVRMPGNAER
jgi:hypothetical protein